MNEPRVLKSRYVRILLLASIVCAVSASGFALWDPLDIGERAHRRPGTTPAASGMREIRAPDIQLRVTLARFALVLGCLLGTLLIPTHLVWKALTRAAAMHRSHVDLEQCVKELTLELHRTNAALQNEIAEGARVEDALRRLSGRLLQLQDEERRRVARELHDSIGGLLTGLSFNLERMQRIADDRQDAALAGVTEDSVDLLGRVTTEVRTLSHLLHPPMLDELGFECVLPAYVAGFAKRSGITVTCDVQSNLGASPETELTLFRIVQEALTNIHRHSGSPTAAVAVWRDLCSISAQIEDHGRGIPLPSLHRIRREGAELGVGIAGMRERVRQLQGEFEMTASAKGTTVRVSIPVSTGMDNVGSSPPPPSPTGRGRTAA